MFPQKLLKAIHTPELDWGPSYMVSGTRDNPSLEATLSSVYMSNVVPVGRAKVNPSMIIHKSYWIIKCANIPLSLGFSRSFDHSGFFTSLIRISAINPKSKHYVTLATPRVVPVRRAKAFICRNVVPLARVTLPVEVRQLAPPELSRPRRRVRDPDVNGWLKFGKKQAKCYLGQGSPGEGCLGCPRPYNWALRKTKRSNEPRLARHKAANVNQWFFN